MPRRTVRCYYATDPTARPACQLTAAVRYGTVSLGASCARLRSTLGKGQRPVPLPAADPVDVLHGIAEARRELRSAERTLAGAVSRARRHGHPWSTIAAQLGITRQRRPPTLRSARRPSHAPG